MIWQTEAKPFSPCFAASDTSFDDGRVCSMQHACCCTSAPRGAHACLMPNIGTLDHAPTAADSDIKEDFPAGFKVTRNDACFADPNLLKPYIIQPTKRQASHPFQLSMRSFAQKDRNDCLQYLFILFRHDFFDNVTDNAGTSVQPSWLKITGLLILWGS